MAVTKTTDVKTVKQSWHNVVSTLDREETPFYTAIGSNESGNVIREFFSKKLNDATFNAAPEGADAPAATFTDTSRAANAMQIFRKVRSISGTLEASDNVGVSSKFAEQLEDAGKELKRDIEKALLGAQGSVLSGTRELAGVEAWIKTNKDHGAGGATAGFDESTNLVADVTAGTKRAITEDMLNAQFEALYSVGSRARTIYVHPKQKKKLSALTGGRVVNIDAASKTLTTAVDVFESDYGVFKVKMDYLMSDSTVLILDEKEWAVSYLRPIEKKDLPEGGDYKAKMLITELTLEARNERANAKIADLL